MSLNEHLERYFRGLEASRAFLDLQATPENIEKAHTQYEQAKQALEEYKTNNTQGWQEYTSLKDEWMWTQDRQKKSDLLNKVLAHPAEHLKSAVRDAMTYYSRLVNAAERKK